MSSGWQQPPVYPPKSKPRCPHLGLLFAAMALRVHPEGHVWVCPCGARYVVVSDGGQNKRLEKQVER